MRAHPYVTSLPLLLLLSALPMSGSLAGATLIDFDDVVAPCGFSDTMALRSAYAASGVTFSAPGNDGGARLGACSVFAVTGYSPPNFLAFNASAFYLGGGTPRVPETVTFDAPVSHARFNAGSAFDPGFTVSAEAFDETAASLGSASMVVGATLKAVNLPFPGMKSFVITFDGPMGILVVDDLAFFPLPGCPNVGGTPQSLTVKRTELNFKPDPDADRFKVTGRFSTTTPFDPAFTHTMYLTISDSEGGVIWASGAIVPGGAVWASSNPATKKFVYRENTATSIPGLKQLKITESPRGSGTFKLTAIGVGANLLTGPPTVGTHQAALEFSAPLCFGGTTTSCTKATTRERCK